MKKSLSLFISLLFFLSLATVAFAQSGPPGTGWHTGILLQNIDATDGSISIEAIGTDSTATYTNTIIGGGVINIMPSDFTGMSSGFQGGAVVSSTTQIRAVVNVTNRYISNLSLGDSGALHPGAGQYQGVIKASTELLFPLAKNDHYGKTTTFYIQNAGSVDTVANANFTFGGSSYTFTTPTVKPGGMVVFSPADSKNSSGNPPPSGSTQNAAGALSITASQPLAGTVLEHKTAEAHGSLLQANRGFTPDDSDSILYVPMNKDTYFNRWSGLNVMNTGINSVDIRVTYTTGEKIGTCNVNAGSKFVSTKTGIAPKSLVIFPSVEIPGNGCAASAVVEIISGGGGTIIAAITESFTNAYLFNNPSKYQESTTYAAFPASSATTTLSVPSYKEDSYDKSTGITVQNVNPSQSAFIVATFTGPAGKFVTKPIEIPANGFYNLVDMRLKPTSIWNGTPMTSSNLGCVSGNYICRANGLMGVMIEASGGNIVAMANESTYPFTNPRIQQDKNNYEGFNLP